MLSCAGVFVGRCCALQKLTGSADGLLSAQRAPSTPLQRLAAHQKEVAELVSGADMHAHTAAANMHTCSATVGTLAYAAAAGMLGRCAGACTTGACTRTSMFAEQLQPLRAHMLCRQPQVLLTTATGSGAACRCLQLANVEVFCVLLLLCACAQVESLKAARAEAKGHAYREYALDKQLAFVSDPSNIAFEELELPHLVQVGAGLVHSTLRVRWGAARRRSGCCAHWIADVQWSVSAHAQGGAGGVRRCAHGHELTRQSCAVRLQAGNTMGKLRAEVWGEQRLSCAQSRVVSTWCLLGLGLHMTQSAPVYGWCPDTLLHMEILHTLPSTCKDIFFPPVVCAAPRSPCAPCLMILARCLVHISPSFLHSRRSALRLRWLSLMLRRPSWWRLRRRSSGCSHCSSSHVTLPSTLSLTCPRLWWHTWTLCCTRSWIGSSPTAKTSCTMRQCRQQTASRCAAELGSNWWLLLMHADYLFACILHACAAGTSAHSSSDAQAVTCMRPITLQSSP